MEGLLPFALLLGASGSILYYSHNTRRARRTRREGFEGLIGPETANAFPGEHTAYVQKSAEKYNPIMNLLNPQNNVLLPPEFKPADAISAEQKLKSALRAPIATPLNPSFQLKASNTADILLNKGGEGTATRDITMCEAVKTADCNAFDKEDFAYNCGICHEGGETSQGKPQIGGLFILEDDRSSAELSAKRMNSRTVNYQPSTGKCNPNMFSTSKKQCIRIQKEQECQAKQSFGSDCGQCMQDGAFHYVDPTSTKSDPRLILVGSGSLTLNQQGKGPVTKDLSATPQEVSLGGLAEGDLVTLDVTGTESNPPSIAGYLVGTTITGDFRMDIVRLIMTDAVTGSKPRLTGSQQVGSDMYSLLRPGRGQLAMRLSMTNTFTFLEPTEFDAMNCGSAPFVTKASSAQILESGTCYTKGQAPGAYSQACLQELFLSAGCTVDGKGYPNTAEKAQALMKDPKGNNLSIGEIANAIYTKSIQAFTGKNNGQDLDIQSWDTVSQFCTGKKLTGPCDAETVSGPYSAQCLSYLWQNGDGTTYSGGTQIASLGSKGQNRYCTPDGSLAPIGADGKPNTATILLANSKGDKTAIKNFYNQISLRANDNTLEDSQRQEAIQQCYGVRVDVKTSAEQAVVGGVPKYIIFGSWIGGQLIGTETRRLNNGQTIYIVEDGPYTKMVTRNGQGKYYVGKINQFDPNAWDSYSVAPPGAYNVRLPYESVLDGNKGRNKTLAQQSNYIFEGTLRDVIVLGPIGIGPWGTTWSGLENFPKDPNTQWIWNSPGAQNNAPSSINIRFVYFYTNTTQSAQQATLSFVVDNYGVVYLNNQILTNGLEGFNQLNVTFAPGENMVELVAQNFGGPAGLAVICKQGPTTLFRSGPGWKFVA